MAIEFNPSTINTLRPMVETYLNTLTGVADDFWEEHILTADFYEIRLDGEAIGCFAVWNKEKITLFVMEESRLFLAQPVFERILSEFKIKTAFAATCDELFLSLCLDFHRRVEPQAYFFDGTHPHPVRPPEYGRECVRPVAPEELKEVQRMTGDFFEFVTKRELETGGILLYRLTAQGKTLGFGIIDKGKLLKNYWSCGMITLPENRRKGVGRSMQIHLGDICREKGAIPISGCWYHNHLSKKTIQSAGRFSRTRLLNIIFEESDT